MTELKHLFEELEKNAAGDIYPYHMPGHKRRACGRLPEALYTNDITEIEGFDNLHQPEDMLLALQMEAARLYGAQESYYLVNGSTCGILSAVSCVLPLGGHILMARNCHKSAYHGAYLRSLAITYLYPPYLTEYDIFDAIAPQQIEKALEQEKDIGAVLIVSPTYEGRIADIRNIADIVHSKGIPLIVDEAHGAHLGLAEGWPPNSCRQGADLVIHSIHKTLPALTQTALLHVNGSLVDRKMLKRFLHIYQSSSPSYLLMASIDNALQYVEQAGGEAFRRFRMRYGRMMEELAKCRYLKFLPFDEKRQDVGKLLISVKETELTGKQLNDILLQKYHLQMEMASDSYVLAMFTVNDGDEAYDRMTKALLEIDREMSVKYSGQDCTVMRGEEEYRQKSGCDESGMRGSGPEAGGGEAGMPPVKASQGIPLARAWDRAVETVALEDSVGKYAGEFVNRYPPGIPLLVPGEEITDAICRGIRQDILQGLNVQGVGIERNERGGVAGTGKKLTINVLIEE